MKQEVVYVGLSGGVDSSVAALRLLRAGHTVVGVFIRTWHPDFVACTEEADRLDAMRVAAHLGIPFLTFDAVDAYKQHVANYMIREYTAGRTPNPDVMCNRHVKFGAFLTWALSQGADAVATGHYARMELRENIPTLLRGIDHTKDQSYFLWQLTREDLRHIRFPVGDSLKRDVRMEAQHAGIPVFDKRDSQGICFLGQVDMREFLRHYISIEPGKVLDRTGKVVGHHEGALFYTLGERHGFTITDSNAARTVQYVVEKNVDKNTLTVDAKPKLLSDNTTVTLREVVLRTDVYHDLNAQFRYRQKPFPVTVEEPQNGCAMLTVLNDTVEQPPNGQSCVLYRNDECVGGGIIS